LRVALCGLRGGAQPRQRAISRRRLQGQLGEGGLCLGVLVLFGEICRLVKDRARLSRLLGLQILVAAPAAHRGDDQERAGHQEDGIPVPELLELVTAYFLVNFIKQFRHLK